MEENQDKLAKDSGEKGTEEGTEKGIAKGIAKVTEKWIGPSIDETGKECCLQEVGDTVQRMVRVFQLFERDQIKVFGFTSSQCYCLLEIFKAQGLTMNELSDKMNLNTSTMTRVVDKLVRDGYIVRSKDEEDRRVVFVNLTPKGQESAIKLNESINEYYRQIIEHLPGGRVEEVLSAVSLLINAFEKANPNCC